MYEKTLINAPACMNTDQSSDVHDHDEELVVPVADGQFDFTQFFTRGRRPRQLCSTNTHR